MGEEDSQHVEMQEENTDPATRPRTAVSVRPPVAGTAFMSIVDGMLRARWVVTSNDLEVQESIGEKDGINTLYIKLLLPWVYQHADDAAGRPSEIRESSASMEAAEEVSPTGTGPRMDTTTSTASQVEPEEHDREMPLVPGEESGVAAKMPWYLTEPLVFKRGSWMPGTLPTDRHISLIYLDTRCEVAPVLEHARRVLNHLKHESGGEHLELRFTDVQRNEDGSSEDVTLHKEWGRRTAMLEMVPGCAIELLVRKLRLEILSFVTAQAVVGHGAGGIPPEKLFLPELHVTVW
jgi:hypothetical protein